MKRRCEGRAFTNRALYFPVCLGLNAWNIGKSGFGVKDKTVTKHCSETLKGYASHRYRGLTDFKISNAKKKAS